MLESRRGSAISPLRSQRSCVLARRGMVCASSPVASAAGVELLRRGGNAVDAAIAAAAALCVVEPMSTGIGGDAFALLWSAKEGRLVGLNASGRAPAAANLAAYRERGHEQMPQEGILSATVPGAVQGWESLSQAYGALPLGEALAPAIRAAENGFAVSELISHYWHLLAELGALRNEAARRTWLPEGRAPRRGEWFRTPTLARTLRAIAQAGAGTFYNGEVAEAIVNTSREEAGFFSLEDLAEHQGQWVEPISSDYRGVEVVELPPNGQGMAALLALNIFEQLDPAEAPASSALDWHRRIEAIKLAFADRDAFLADPEHAEVPVERLLDKTYAKQRASLIGERAASAVGPGLEPQDTVYVCAADAEGNLVSLIQSLYMGFGSGIACGDTGVLLQNRGAGFRLETRHPNALAPRKRPFHTIIPAMLMRDAKPWVAFGITGAHLQPQAHLGFVSSIVDWNCNPQEALDRARFRYLDGARVAIETPQQPVDEGDSLALALEARGHEVMQPGEAMMELFGGGQAIAIEDDGVLVGASDCRKDGCATGLYDA